MSVTIIVDNEDALVDDVITIRVAGLDSRQQVTVRAEVDEKGQVFAGSGCFTADDSGMVDLSTQVSSAGTYTGVSSMGLFWSMRSTPSMPRGLRLIKNNGTSPVVTELAVYPGHLSFEEIYVSNTRCLCNKTIRRWYMAKDVQKIIVRSGRIRGSLFLPPGGGPFPGVIDMFGTVGACVEFRAALLASRGFAAMALPYFLYDDLPQDMEDVELEYFMEAIDWFAEQPCVDGSNLGMMGVSKGGEIALQVAYYNSKIKSVVSINGAPFLTRVPMRYKGEYIGKSGFSSESVKLTEEAIDARESLHCDIKDYIPLWTRDVHALLICGLDDGCLKPDYLQNLYSCYPPNKKHLCKLCAYKGAGHLIEPPYAPLARITKKNNRGIPGDYGAQLMFWGGETAAHAHAQEDSWEQILRHFRTTLSSPNSKHYTGDSKL